MFHLSTVGSQCLLGNPVSEVLQNLFFIFNLKLDIQILDIKDG